MNKFLLTACIIFLSPGLLPAVDAQSEKIDFFRPSVPGRTCRVNASVRSSCLFALRASAAAKSPGKLEESVAAISGTMKVLECSPKGNPLLFEFVVDSFSGNSRGNAIDPKVLAGKTLLVQKTLASVSFSIIGGGEFTVPEKNLLHMLFQPDDNLCLNDIIGTDRALKPGDSWTLVHEAKEGISFSGSAALKGRETFADTECWNIEYSVSASDGKGLSSDAFTRILLPVETGKGGPLKIKSKQKRKIEKALPAENPLTAGSILNVDESTEFIAEITPLN